ncbi:MAG: hypothetical protein H6732_06720 [Alphaproteobacteria bacterium]|nr:hypothetical protein [Alphaproteobacteria bacterium]
MRLCEWSEALQAEHVVQAETLMQKAPAPTAKVLVDLGRREGALAKEVDLAEGAVRRAVGQRRLGHVGRAWLEA